MSTTAAVIWKDKVHYYGSDGYPSEIVPELVRMARLQDTNERAFWMELHNDWEFKSEPYGPESWTEFVYQLDEDWTSVKVTGHAKSLDFNLKQPIRRWQLDVMRWTDKDWTKEDYSDEDPEETV